VWSCHARTAVDGVGDDPVRGVGDRRAAGEQRGGVAIGAHALERDIEPRRGAQRRDDGALVVRRGGGMVSLLTAMRWTWAAVRPNAPAGSISDSRAMR